MTRDIRILPTAALTATTIALVAFVAQHPAAAKWAGVVALVLAVGGLFTLAKESIDLRAELDDERRRSEAFEDRCAELTTALHATQTAADLRAVDPAPPTLRVVADDLYVVDPPSDDAPEADESWLTETPLFHDVCFKNWEKR